MLLPAIQLVLSQQTLNHFGLSLDVVVGSDVVISTQYTSEMKIEMKSEMQSEMWDGVLFIVGCSNTLACLYNSRQNICPIRIVVVSLSI